MTCHRYGGPRFLGRISHPAGDKALPSLSPTANPAGIWEGIVRRRRPPVEPVAFSSFPACLPNSERTCRPDAQSGRTAAALRAGAGQEPSMDAVYVTLGVAFFVVALALV